MLNGASCVVAMSQAECHLRRWSGGVFFTMVLAQYLVCFGEDVGVERLGDEGVDADWRAEGRVGHRVGRDHDHRGERPPLVGAHPPVGLHPRKAPQADVEQQAVGLLLVERPQHLVGVGGVEQDDVVMAELRRRVWRRHRSAAQVT